VALIQQWLGLEDSNGKPIPTPTSRFPNGVPSLTPPKTTPKNTNTYTPTPTSRFNGVNPQTFNKPNTSVVSSGNNSNGCPMFDFQCLLKGLNLPPIIPGIPTEIVLVGGIGIIILYMVIR
jgi:hypothetical protein